jgi:hypothetical protein
MDAFHFVCVCVAVSYLVKNVVTTLLLSIARLEPILFPFIKQICARRAQVYNLWTTVAVLLKQRTPFTIIRITHAYASANHAPPLICSIITFITHAHERRRSHVGITNHALAVACPKSARASVSQFVLARPRAHTYTFRINGRSQCRAFSYT